MCGRYTLKTNRSKLAERFGLEDLGDFTPRFNLGPTQEGLVVRTGDAPGTRTAAWLRWGLIPAWTKSVASQPLLINARSETVASRPAFRDAFKHRRCLVLADGFYEWSRQGRARVPYHLTLRHGEPFAMAGLWERWHPPGEESGEAVETFTILTTAANDVLAPLHDRMPVILDDGFLDDWINPLVTDPEVLQPLLKPYPPAHMLARPVSARVNSIKFDDPECLAPPSGAPGDGPGGPGPATGGQLDFDLGN